MHRIWEKALREMKWELSGVQLVHNTRLKFFGFRFQVMWQDKVVSKQLDPKKRVNNSK